MSRTPLRRGIQLLVATLTCALLIPLVHSRAEAFCGFYVSGGTADLYNNATMVVMMRDGQRTVLSMQNTYEGPPEDFAMVVPVPVVLKKDNVKTLPPAIFTKVDQMAAPRLVEYWEQDPCWIEPPMEDRRLYKSGAMVKEEKRGMPSGGKVTVEAKFEVGEYEIVILSATEATALDTWLKAQRYNLPSGAQDSYRPYIDAGMYFFVARVNVKKVQFADGRARLSPLRFHYDSKTFNLPVRLGLLNADGAQDLIVHILARNQRYEVANYPNATIPTNIDVTEDVRERFGEFYASLYDKTQAKHPRAVVTEYAWDASSCDPCPGPNLDGSDFLTLGADTLPDKPQWGFALTRLHARYTKAELTEDLVFQAAPPITGGREVYADVNELEQGSKPASVNNFQGRYAIRHVWTGEITCENPVRGRWGGPPGGGAVPGVRPAQDTAFVKRGAFQLPSVLRKDIPEIDLRASTTTRDLIEGKKGADALAGDKPAAEPTTPVAPATPVTPEAPPAEGASGGCTTVPHAAPTVTGLLLIAGAALLGLRRR